jgi:G3E family GTPase
VSNWTWAEAPHLGSLGVEASPGIIGAEVPENVQVIFFVTNGLTDPIDQIEAFKTWVAAQGLELGRVITVVDCKLAADHPPLLAWFDGLIHFSDVVLLNHREGVSNKWMSDFELRYKKLAYPALFEFVRNNKVHNPALILDEVALRVSHVFEDEVEWLVDDEEDMDEEDIPDGEAEVEVAAEVDPYFERLNGGRRVKELPDIRKYV